MEPEYILWPLVYLIVGTWICYKRDWYCEEDEDPNWRTRLICVIAILFTIINLVMTFCEVYIGSKWDNSQNSLSKMREDDYL